MTGTLNLFDSPSEKSEKKWFNTISAVNPELSQYKKDAKFQEQRVLKLFNGGEKLTALEACRRTGLNHDSGKRAVTVLKNKGVLTKLAKPEMVREEYGKMNHLFQLTALVSEESLKLIELEKLNKL